uniref:Uncharacterized protein LOC111137016 n=1 Tax=Crassostrea virginica TaxID=6565 RepID=A0A8B8EVC8_CRAVI|nr:uncharacterized protein LOC111137016 [Crassostrea virginica]
MVLELITTIGCSYPNWCSTCGVLDIALDVGEVVVDSSHCSKFHDNDILRLIIGSRKTKERRCCEGTVTVYSNRSDGTTTEPSTTESYTHGAPNAHLPTFSDLTPYVLAGAGGLFLFFVFIILVSVFVQKKRKPIVRYGYNLNGPLEPFNDRNHQLETTKKSSEKFNWREKARWEVNQDQNSEQNPNPIDFQPSCMTSEEEADYVNMPEYVNITSVLSLQPRRCRGSPIVPPPGQESLHEHNSQSLSD